MTLAKLLELSIQDKLREDKILRFSKIFARPYFVDLIKKYDPELLFKLAMVNPKIDELCKLPELSFYWEDLWRQCGVNPSENVQDSNDPIQEYQPMATVPSCFDLLKGFYLYEKYRDTFENANHTEAFFKDAEEYLAASAKYGCYFASNALCKGGLHLLNNHFDESIALKVLAYAQQAAQFYLSPGYLLLANILQELVKYQDKFLGLNLPIEAFKALKIAKKLEPYSEPMINNAYQGKTLEQASAGMIKSYFQTEMRMANYLNLSQYEIAIASQKATIEVDSIINSIKAVNPATVAEYLHPGCGN